MNVVILCIDRIQAGFLGPYGNTWVDTPGLNRLAAEAFLFENCFTATNDLWRGFESLVSGRHPALLRNGKTAPIRLPGRKALLISDDREILESDAAQGFDEAYSLASLTVACDAPADDWSETPIARLAAETVQILTQSAEPFTAYCRFDYLNRTWQAPIAFREHYLSEDDSPAEQSTTPPCLRAETDQLDPDVVFLHQVSYAAEITVLDRCLEAFVKAIDEARPNTLFVFTSARGYPLGEHGVVGPDERLYNETLHVPLLIRFPERQYAGLRSPTLCYAHDLLPMAAEWILSASADEFGRTIDEPSGGASPCPLCGRHNPVQVIRRPFTEPAQQREALLAVESFSDGGIAYAVRTKHWFARGLRLQQDDASVDLDPIDVETKRDSRGELFFKPDDYWEVSDVADRCDEVLSDATQFAHSVVDRHGTSKSPACDGTVAIPESLTRPVD
ncbi:hypothetical protein JCM19992_14610 [Thermostilla marina]